MRNEVIDRSTTTQEQLYELGGLLVSLGEPIYDDTSMFNSLHHIDIPLSFGGKNNEWGGWGHQAPITTVTVADFLIKYGKGTQKYMPYGPAWKNPKPKVKNTLSVVFGDLVITTGSTVLRRVSGLDGANVILDDDNRYELSDVYPVRNKPITESISVGDICTDAYSYNIVHIVKQVTDEGFINTAGISVARSSLGFVYEVGKPTIAEILRYSCGTLSEEIEGRVTYKDVSYSYEHHLIAKHYSTNADTLIAKDVEILTTLQTTLDHPINIQAKEWALLYGASGSGKTEVCIAYAKSVGRDYVKQQGSAQLTVDDFMGYKSITTGKYVSSLLRTAVENGLIYILDEIDSCNPNTLLALNGLKQEYFQFPDVLVKVHENFRLIATANTLEYNEQYNARSPMDLATLARFDKIQYEMSEIHLALRYGLKYVKQLGGLDRLTPREIERAVNKLKIKES